MALALLLRAVRLPEHHWAHVLVLLPTISALADYLENAGIRVLLVTYPEQPPIVPAMSAVTTIKLATGWACIVVLALLAGTAVHSATPHRALTLQDPNVHQHELPERGDS